MKFARGQRVRVRLTKAARDYQGTGNQHGTGAAVYLGSPLRAGVLIVRVDGDRFYQAVPESLLTQEARP